MLLATADSLARVNHSRGDVHVLSVSFDACFRMIHKRSGRGDDSDALFAHDYFHPTDNIDMEPAAPERGDCSQFRAIDLAMNKTKSTANDRNAICGAVCGRHGVPIPGTFGDIQVGEKFVYADRALRNIVKRCSSRGWHPRVAFIYDIACQYVKRIKEVSQKLGDGGASVFNIALIQSASMMRALTGITSYSFSPACMSTHTMCVAKSCTRIAGEMESERLQVN